MDGKLLDQLRAAWPRLPTQQQQILGMLFGVEGHEFAAVPEIASYLGLTPTKVIDQVGEALAVAAQPANTAAS